MGVLGVRLEKYSALGQTGHIIGNLWGWWCDWVLNGKAGLLLAIQ